MTDQELIVHLTKENLKFKTALQQIAAWKLPMATCEDYTMVNLGKADKPIKLPCSYEMAYGSNGVRDFMRKVASDALKA